jgi:hypothetical protein
MIEDPSFTSVTEGGYTVTSTSESKEQLTEALKPEPSTKETPTEAPAEDLSEAAAKLGKKGGEVSAAKRAEAKAEPVTAETPPDPDEDDDEEEQRTEGKKHPRSDPKARINVLVREREEARRQAAAYAAELEQARATKAPETPKPAPTGDKPRPKSEDFENYEDFVEAISDWKAEQRLTAFQKESSVRAAAVDYANRVGRAAQTFNGRIEEAAKADPTIKERIVRLAETLQPTFLLEQGQRPGPLNTVADEIFISKHAPALMMYFEEHPEDLQRIAELRTPTDVQVEVRLIARGLDGVTAGITSKPEVSKAKPPVRPVTGTPHIAETVPGESASYEDHKRYWGSKDRAARR